MKPQEEGHGLPKAESSPPWEGEAPDLDQFHHINKDGEPTSVFDYEVLRYFEECISLFVVGGVPYLYRDGIFQADITGAETRTIIRSLIYPQFVKAATERRLLDLITADAKFSTTTEEMNSYPPEWICFQNGFYDPVNRKMVPHSPEFRALNQIPHEYYPEKEATRGEAIEEWFRFIFDNEDDREMFLQYAGYCMTRDTRQQKFLILCGGGGTGKSTLIRLLETVIGLQNISNVALQNLNQRFASYDLLGKLLNSCADLEVSALEDVSILKKLLGEDQIRGEPKGKQATFFRNYAKLIFSTNELPTVKAERTNGFYRRLLILEMDKKPQRRRPDFFQTLERELPYFIGLCVQALERMYEGGTLKESSGSREAVQRLRCESDTVEAFLSDERLITRDKEARTKKKDLYQLYTVFCRASDRQALKKQSFFKALRAKGFKEVKSTGIEHFRGVSITEGAEKALADSSGEEFGELLGDDKGVLARLLRWHF